MNLEVHKQQQRLAFGLALISTIAASELPAFAQSKPTPLYRNNLVVSRSVYDNKASNVIPGTILPPNCAQTQGSCAASSGAPDNGTYPYVFNNDQYDGSFGITSRIYLDQLDLTGGRYDTIEVPNSDEGGPSSADHLVTSFSSKSELALNLSTDGKYLTFMGYVAPVNAIDVSNSNTPLAVDPTNPDGQTYYRAIAKVGNDGKFTFTETNAYSGNNGRAAILNNSNGSNVFYTAGNAGNGASPQPEGVVLGAGAQIVSAVSTPENSQTPGSPTPVGSFSVALLGDKADKIGKDDNFRGMTVFNNVLYYTKGSGGNGVNTVYFVDTTGTACPNGIGLPAAGAKLPTAPLAYDPAKLKKSGLPSNMCILSGFPTELAKTNTTFFPFGIWFANSTTLYVADEGDGYNGGTDLYTHAAAQTTAGLQKWVFDSASQSWKFAYVLNKGLNIGVPRHLANFPDGINSATGISFEPANDGLRNITGLVGPDGLVGIWGITSTVSGSGDQGADPNQLMVVLDILANTDAAIGAQLPFYDFENAQAGEVLRGVSFTPGTDLNYFTRH